MRHLLSLLLLLLSVPAVAQGQTLQGRVVDAETGEPLPYAGVRAGSERRTLTNMEGDFKLTLDGEDALTVSYVGYESRTVAARKMPATIRLRPYRAVLQEVTIHPVDADDVVRRVIKNLRRDYKRGEKWTRKYFFRTMIEEDSINYLAEAFMTARSVVNVRAVELLSGLQGYDGGGGRKRLNLNSSNIHRLVEVAPQTHKSGFWEQIVKPLADFKEMRQHYDLRLTTMLGEEGKMLYKIEFLWSDLLSKRAHAKRHIAGTAYVDAQTCRLLRFDGICGNWTVMVGYASMPVTMRFQLDYDYGQDVASVGKMAVWGDNDVLSYHALLFAIEQDRQEGVRTTGSTNNIVSEIQRAGHDPRLWEKYDIVKRTAEEERAAFGKAAAPEQ